MWKPLSKVSVIAGISAAVIFWIHALTDKDGFLIFDYVNLPFHDFGHLFFRLFGDALSIWGGTIMQVLIPFGIFASFYLRKETAGVAFSGFWLGENFLNISVYIGDARRMMLPLVGGGEHDWNIILTDLGMLRYDTFIAGIVKIFGWLIMLSSISWFAYQGIKSYSEEE